MNRVKGGDTLVITERGKPVGRIVPVKTSLETRMQEMVQAGLLAWNGQKFAPPSPVARTRGERTVAELLLGNRE